MDLVLRKRIACNVYRRPSFANMFRKSIGYSKPNIVTSVGVTHEIVGNIPKVYEVTNIDNDVQDSMDNDYEKILENYMQAMTSVEPILGFERLKQLDLIQEIEIRKEEELNNSLNLRKGMKKTLSTPNIYRTPSNPGLTMAMNSRGQMGSMRNLHGSNTSLNVDQQMKPSRRS